MLGWFAGGWWTACPHTQHCRRQNIHYCNSFLYICVCVFVFWGEMEVSGGSENEEIILGKQYKAMNKSDQYVLETHTVCQLSITKDLQHKAGLPECLAHMWRLYFIKRNKTLHKQSTFYSILDWKNATIPLAKNEHASFLSICDYMFLVILE